jgi:hypothetical protein
MKVETTIRNSEKTDQGLQVSPGIIQREVEEDLQKSVLLQPNAQVEMEITEEVLKRAERFLRKVGPLVEKELEENLPLYGRKDGSMQVWAVAQGSRASSGTRDWSIRWRTRTQGRISYRSRQFPGTLRE